MHSTHITRVVPGLHHDSQYLTWSPRPKMSTEAFLQLAATLLVIPSVFYSVFKLSQGLRARYLRRPVTHEGDIEFNSGTISGQITGRRPQYSGSTRPTANIPVHSGTLEHHDPRVDAVVTHDETQVQARGSDSPSQSISQQRAEIDRDADLGTLEPAVVVELSGFQNDMLPSSAMAAVTVRAPIGAVVDHPPQSPHSAAASNAETPDS